MPNGWYPVTGLDVVRINRTEQDYPRFWFSQGQETFRAIGLHGSRGMAPTALIEFPREEGDPFTDLVTAARQAIQADPVGGSASADAVQVNFRTRRGGAVGGFIVYAFRTGRVDVLVDPTVGGAATREERNAMQPFMRELLLRRLVPNGFVPENLQLEDCRFEFHDAHALVISSTALHFDAHWPPKNALDCVAIALAKERKGLDCLVAIWTAEIS